MSTINAFAERDFFDVQQACFDRVRDEIYAQPKEYILGVKQDEYLDFLRDKFRIEPLTFEFDKCEATEHESMLRSEFGQQRVPVYTVHVPTTGNPDLFGLRPSRRELWSTKIEVSSNTISFDVIDYSKSVEEVNRGIESIKKHLLTQAGYLNADVERFNSAIRARAEEVFLRRRGEVQQQEQVTAKLVVPIRKSTTVPTAFSIPVVRKKVATRPQVSPRQAKPEFFLDPAIYEDVLKTIHEVGKVFERLPSTYAGKDEEALRDLLITYLETRFEGSATGETFNKAGKTDILLRHEKTNVFVAECKFWGGKKRYHETIDQLLSYLSWRDSKTAIVNFVRGKEIIPILKEIKSSTPEHPRFSRSFSGKDDSWQAFELKLPGDDACFVQTAILTFHLPEKK